MADLTAADFELSLEEIQNMKVTDLRKKLKAFGLPITGNKTELVERLQEACLSNKGGDSFENSHLSYDESQISGLESAEDCEALEESALLDQDNFSTYISSSLDDDTKTLGNAENKLSSNSVIMPPKKRTFTKTDVGEMEKKVLLNRTNATDISFEIEEKQTESKPVTINTDNDKKDNSDEKIKLSVKSMTAAERLAMRAKRFNTTNSEVKSTASLKPVKAIDSRNSKQSILASATTPDLDVLKKRAERFGQCVSTVMKQIEQKERLLKRKCKFGANLAISSTTSLDEQAKKKQRAERFGIS